MANRTLYPSQSYGAARQYLEFRFDANGAANPLLTTLVGAGADTIASLVRSGVGIIVVTLKDPFTKVVRASAELDDTVNDGAYATVGGITGEGTNTGLSFTVRTRTTGGVLTDYSARRCSIGLVLSNGNWGVR